ncbi:HAD hydrolase family protein [Anaerosacchariphilus polymeriproducens]|uniref:HAD family phosphatase n=1 Tax=Anaerosacchariphilus polymeriproducens TaxID=1812858 RepID=A0A371ARI3_9FIRM|nr:HAD family hydrolase [Anaerosacchariphilus polymeriproducens]RDU22173.1 HAD family phosphatase [Anaerosacchariphilus polymeriproducens]
MSAIVRLLGIDLDGTLLNNKQEISIVDEKAIRKTMEQGVIVVPITGLPKSDIPKKIQRLFENSYWITSNGAVTTVAKCKTDIVTVNLNYEVVIQILDYLFKMKEVQIEVFMNGMIYVESNHMKEVKNKYKDTSLKIAIKEVNNLKEFVKKYKNEIVGISVTTSTEDIRIKIQKDLLKYKNIRVTLNKKKGLEIHSIHTSKRSAIVKLGKIIGIDKSEILVCTNSNIAYAIDKFILGERAADSCCDEYQCTSI